MSTEYTLEQIIIAVCIELRIDREELVKHYKRSTKELTIAKQLCTFFAKQYTDACNKDILECLGYKLNNRKQISQNVKAAKDLIDTGQYPDYNKHYQNLQMSFNRNNHRTFTPGDSIKLTELKAETQSPEENPEYKKLMDKGIYPFVIRMGNVIGYAYSMHNGVYTGQTHEQYNTACSTV